MGIWDDIIWDISNNRHVKWGSACCNGGRQKQIYGLTVLLQCFWYESPPKITTHSCTHTQNQNIPLHRIPWQPFIEPNRHGNRHQRSFFLLNWPISSLSGTSPLAASSFEGDGNQPNLNNPPMQTGDQHLTVFLQSWWSCVISTSAQLHTHRRR